MAASLYRKNLFGEITISLYIYKEGEFVGHVAADCSGFLGLIWPKLGWSGRSQIPLPSGGALFGHQGALLECKRCFSQLSVGRFG